MSVYQVEVEVEIKIKDLIYIEDKRNSEYVSTIIGNKKMVKLRRIWKEKEYSSAQSNMSRHQAIKEKLVLVYSMKL